MLAAIISPPHYPPQKTRISSQSKNTIKSAFNCYLSAGENKIPPGNKYSIKCRFQALKSIRNRIPPRHSEECRWSLYKKPITPEKTRHTVNIRQMICLIRKEKCKYLCEKYHIFTSAIRKTRTMIFPSFYFSQNINYQHNPLNKIQKTENNKCNTGIFTYSVSM